VSLPARVVVVLDIDPTHGGDQALADFEAGRREPLSPTLTVVTGNGGKHWDYRLAEHTSLSGDPLRRHLHCRATVRCDRAACGSRGTP
jgi:bifunctional DNA primase/polymerase-like protein